MPHRPATPRAPAPAAASGALARKLGVRPGIRAFLVDAPPEVRAALALPADAVAPRLEGGFDYLHVFVRDAAALDAAFRRLRPHLRVGGMLWVSWPKGRGGEPTLPEVIRVGYGHRLVESKTVSVDATWSAIKFTHPKPGKQYRNSYGRLPDAPPAG